jgi:hypothetical protein
LKWLSSRRGVRLTVERDTRITATVPAGFDTARLAEVVKGRRRWLWLKLVDAVPVAVSSRSRPFAAAL